MKSAAFTLFEVLVALGVFVLAVGGLIAALGKTTEAAALLRDDAEIRRQMESWVDQSMTMPITMLAQGMESERDAMGAIYRLDAEPAEIHNRDNEELTGLWWITVRANWTDDGGKQEWRERFLRYEP